VRAFVQWSRLHEVPNKRSLAEDPIHNTKLPQVNDLIPDQLTVPHPSMTETTGNCADEVKETGSPKYCSI
jgi:phospholipase C